MVPNNKEIEVHTSGTAVTMGTCEMCGESGTLEKTKVEGAKLDLCENCQELGETVEQPRTTKTGSRRSQSTPEEEILSGYGEKVKAARESRDITVKELAEQLKEKESVVKRVESERLTPDQGLARKFESTLDIDIYGTPGETASTTDLDNTAERTIGDVADVTRD